MSKEKVPVTPAVRVLRAAGVEFTEHVERTILDSPRIYINGGKRGYLVGMAPADAQRVLKPTLVSVATEKE